MEGDEVFKVGTGGKTDNGLYYSSYTTQHLIVVVLGDEYNKAEILNEKRGRHARTTQSEISWK